MASEDNDPGGSANAEPAAGRLITPVILTYDEEPNIERSLRSLQWARRIVVVDSGSSDGTERTAKSFPNVSWFTRAFDTHGRQWQFAVRETGVDTPYVLALDADYEVPRAFVAELERRFLGGRYAGGIAGFEYRLLGRALMGSVYPAKLVVFRPEQATVCQPGHTQEWHVDGPIYRFEARLIHDDRKGLARFVRSQMEYARLEESRLAGAGANRWQDRLRRLCLMPFVVGVGSYLKAGGPLRGKSALRYAYERTFFECLLALRLLSGDSEGRRDEAAVLLKKEEKVT